MGWFGPRGLASIVFAIILLDDTNLPHLHTLLLAVTVTIALSVYAHGLTAGPLTDRYTRWWGAHPRDDAGEGLVEVPPWTCASSSAREAVPHACAPQTGPRTIILEGPAQRGPSAFRGRVSQRRRLCFGRTAGRSWVMAISRSPWPERMRVLTPMVRALGRHDALRLDIAGGSWLKAYTA
jgi:hypothetical protein